MLILGEIESASVRNCEWKQYCVCLLSVFEDVQRKVFWNDAELEDRARAKTMENQGFLLCIAPEEKNDLSEILW